MKYQGGTQMNITAFIQATIDNTFWTIKNLEQGRFLVNKTRER